jgi:hypothetical protein
MQQPVTQTHPNALAEQARFVFRGTLEQTGASTVPDIVPAANNAWVVNVEEILQSPQSLAQAAGQRVTVLLPEGVTLAAGEHDSSVLTIRLGEYRVISIDDPVS